MRKALTIVPRALLLVLPAILAPTVGSAQAPALDFSYTVQAGTVVEGCGGIAGRCTDFALHGELSIRLEPGTSAAVLTSATLAVVSEEMGSFPLELPLGDMVGSFDPGAIRFSSREDPELGQFLEWTMFRAGTGLVLQGVFFEGCCDRFTFDFRNVSFEEKTTGEPSTVLLLGGGRFVVRARWTDFEGKQGTGKAVGLGKDSGYFWFFDAGNTEITVKVLDACRGFERFWVFAAGMTNVEVELVVTDLVAGVERVYGNAMGATFETILDTDAFATCDARP